MTPRPVRQMNVSYLFAGAPRKADLRACFSQLIANFNACDEFDFSVDLAMDEVDLLRGGQAHYLLDAGRRAAYLARLRAVVEVLINSPPCDTFTRARHSGMPGPPPVRDWQRQRGFNNLAPWAQKSVEDANTLADFALEAMHVAADAGVLAVLAFSEDLGRTRCGTPASL